VRSITAEKPFPKPDNESPKTGQWVDLSDLAPVHEDALYSRSQSPFSAIIESSFQVSKPGEQI
jgi:hypothetical protein